MSFILVKITSKKTRNYAQNDEWGAPWGTYLRTGCRLIPNLELVRLS